MPKSHGGCSSGGHSSSHHASHSSHTSHASSSHHQSHTSRPSCPSHTSHTSNTSHASTSHASRPSHTSHASHGHCATNATSRPRGGSTTHHGSSSSSRPRSSPFSSRRKPWSGTSSTSSHWPRRHPQHHPFSTTRSAFTSSSLNTYRYYGDDGGESTTQQYGPGGRVRDYVGTGEYLRGNTNYLRLKLPWYDQSEIDPFVEFYNAQDSKVMELTIDVEEMSRAINAKQKKMVSNELAVTCGLEIICFLFPCVWCFVCDITDTVMTSARLTAENTQLFLREKSIYFKLNTHTRKGYANNLPYWSDSEHTVFKLEMAFPLSQVDFELLPSDEQPCVACMDTMEMDIYYPIPTLLIKIDGLVIAEIDGPANFDEFYRAFQEQKSKATQMAVPVDIQSKHDLMVRKLVFYRDQEEKTRIVRPASSVVTFAADGATTSGASSSQLIGVAAPVMAEMVRNGDEEGGLGGDVQSIPLASEQLRLEGDRPVPLANQPLSEDTSDARPVPLANVVQTDPEFAYLALT